MGMCMLHIFCVCGLGCSLVIESLQGLGFGLDVVGVRFWVVWYVDRVLGLR